MEDTEVSRGVESMKEIVSLSLFEEASKLIPGGVNSPVRAFKAVQREPLYIKRGKGSKIYDLDDHEYIDYVCSWGPLIFGHADEKLLQVLIYYANQGTSFGANTEIEVKFAHLLTEVIPSIEMVRMVNSGTEATMSAVRLARGFTGRDKIIKFDGCYHGHSDSFLIKAGSGVLTMGLTDTANNSSLPYCPGVTKGTAADTLIAEYNNIATVKELMKNHKGELAAVILEPVMGNAGVILPERKFLKELRELTLNEGVLLIFDEVITGLRVALGGAQELYGIKPDLTCLGKIIGGGLPVGAFGGRADIMRCLAPEGPVYQAGTLSGNPVAMALGYETVKRLQTSCEKEKQTGEPSIYTQLEEKGRYLQEWMEANSAQIKVPIQINRVGSLFSLFFTDKKVTNLKTAFKARADMFVVYFSAMLEKGIYLAPSPFEAGFISTAHTEADLFKTIEANYASLYQVRQQFM